MPESVRCRLRPAPIDLPTAVIRLTDKWFAVTYEVILGQGLPDYKLYSFKVYAQAHRQSVNTFKHDLDLQT